LLQLSSRTAFVTGGASGIGLGMVKAFLDAGMKLLQTYVTTTWNWPRLKWVLGTT
jgi:NAD(P)-dependent dehydrogenase (short-subunit alcohol dehydrogenase family)